MFEKKMALAIWCIYMIAAPTAAVASGSGGGGYGSGGSSYPQQQTPRDPYADAYARGKSQFKKHITCKKCEFSEGVHDSVTAGKVAKRVKAGAFQLNEKQRADVMIFMERRYGVTA